MVEHAGIWRSRSLLAVELPGDTGFGLGGKVAEVRVRPSFWVFRVLDLFTGAPSGDSNLILLVLDTQVVALKRVYSDYDLDVAVNGLKEMLAAGDLAGIAEKYDKPQLHRLIEAP